MKNLFFIYFFSLVQYIACSQNQNIDQVLDSIINHPVSGRTQLIHIKNKVIVDTFAIKKLLLHQKDSSIIVKFSNKKSKKIKAVSIWGLTTDFGERRRFYNGKSYTIWRTKAPYVYRVQKNNSFISYYSESLTGEIHLLTRETIESQIYDTIIKRILIPYAPDHTTPGEVAANTILGNKPDKDGAVIKDIAKDITKAVFDTLVSIINNPLVTEIIKGFEK